MNLGPSLIFDKSALQAFNVDESVWLDQFFINNITPLFYIETLADLEKEVSGGRTPEQIVGQLAFKVPDGANPNIHHHTLVVAELCGQISLSMNRKPVIGAGAPKRTQDGRLAVEYRPSQEMEALDRWRKSDFLELERTAAKRWRSDLASHDIEREIAIVRIAFSAHPPISDLAGAKNEIDRLCQNADVHLVSLMLELLDVDGPLRAKICQRWSDVGSPADLTLFSPYATHVFKVRLLYILGAALSLISKERPSNAVDMAYLYYLPFCSVFTSGDKLHSRTAPLFLGEDQMFLPSLELKQALGEIDEHYEAYPKEVKELGVMRFVRYPPSGLCNKLTLAWDELMGEEWRKRAWEWEQDVLSPGFCERPLMSSSEISAIRENAVFLDAGAELDAQVSNPDMIFRQRQVYRSKGKWQIIDPANL